MGTGIGSFGKKTFWKLPWRLDIVVVVVVFTNLEAMGISVMKIEIMCFFEISHSTFNLIKS